MVALHNTNHQGSSNINGPQESHLDHTSSRPAHSSSSGKMESYEKNRSKCLEEAKKLFTDKFGGEGTIFAACAPGRVNLIGEHTDYNDGLVLPMALPLMTVIVGRKSTSDVCSVYSDAEKDTQNFPTPEYPGDFPSQMVPLNTDLPHWIKYVIGVAALMNKNKDVPAFEVIITTCVPLGGGLSSSAALEVATALFLKQIIQGKVMKMKEIALLCQQAEHRYAGIPCGIMDQFISVMATEGHALLIDCKEPVDLKHIPLDDPEIAILVVDSGVKHELAEGEYKKRKESCKSAAKKLEVPSLRSADIKLLNQNREELKVVEYLRARHVISEIDRTKRAAKVLGDKKYSRDEKYHIFGRLMNDSHRSLRDDYEVSCAELDELVDLIMGDKRVFGCRMTGGGFGGCTVTLLPQNIVPATIERIKVKYPRCYVVTASPGATSEL